MGGAGQTSAGACWVLKIDVGNQNQILVRKKKQKDQMGDLRLNEAKIKNDSEAYLHACLSKLLKSVSDFMFGRMVRTHLFSSFNIINPPFLKTGTNEKPTNLISDEAMIKFRFLFAP